jgi:hypothetical protein
MLQPEILTRAREALIKASDNLPEGYISDIRAGDWDHSEGIVSCLHFAEGLKFPLSSIQPPTPRLAAARQWAAGRLESNGLSGEAADVLAGKMDWQPLVVAFLAGASA